jgi:O-antigen/teichoic acid export membrane protein
VGLYSGGYRFVGAFTALPSAVHVVSLPEFHRSSADPEALGRLFVRTRAGLLEIGGLVLGGVAVASPHLIEVFLGSAYTASVPIVAVCAMGMLVTYASYPYSMLIEAEGAVVGRFRWRLVSLAAGAAVTTALSWWLGIVGAAVGVVLAGLSFLVPLHLVTRNRDYGLSELWRAGRPGLVATGLAAGLWTAQPLLPTGLAGLLVAPALYGVGYVVALTVLGWGTILDPGSVGRWWRARARRDGEKSG